MLSNGYNWKDLDSAPDNEVLDTAIQTKENTVMGGANVRREVLLAYLNSRSSRRMIEYTETLVKLTRALKGFTLMLVVLAFIQIALMFCKK